mmetsp:Transcript_13214/g.33278  ORF Transcript_13214/g.33278 Transcript_13214/m.33278 type:complete len:232 (-) Transcript_13214:300-995(-)
MLLLEFRHSLPILATTVPCLNLDGSQPLLLHLPINLIAEPSIPSSTERLINVAAFPHLCHPLPVSRTPVPCLNLESCSRVFLSPFVLFLLVFQMCLSTSFPQLGHSLSVSRTSVSALNFDGCTCVLLPPLKHLFILTHRLHAPLPRKLSPLFLLHDLLALRHSLCSPLNPYRSLLLLLSHLPKPFPRHTQLAREPALCSGLCDLPPLMHALGPLLNPPCCLLSLRCSLKEG